MICLVLSGPRIADNRNALARNRSYIHMAELRVDFLLDNHTLEEIATFAKDVDIPLILTCRTVVDGGAFKGTHKEQIAILKELLESGAFSYIDLEEAIDSSLFKPEAKRLGVEIIISRHDFSGIPLGLLSWMNSVVEQGAIPKAAVTPQSTKELGELLTIGESLEGAAILLGMGAYGFPSRILYKRFRSILSFTSPQGKEVAPGHTTPAYLHACRAEEMGESPESAKVAIFAIVGDPVLHSKSPELHNSWFAQRGVAAGYIHFPIDNITHGVALLRRLGVRGVSITMPHKEGVLPLLTTVSSEVREIGSCNTMILSPVSGPVTGELVHSSANEPAKPCNQSGHSSSTKLIGYNTDYLGVQNPFVERNLQVVGKDTYILGAGGAARSAAVALHNLGAKITFVNRTRSRAEALVGDLGFGTVADQVPCGDSVAREHSPRVDIIVQATSLGMDGQGNPLPNYPWREGMVLFETIYSPERTPIVVEAEQCGVSIILGMEMLRAQGVEQNRIFSNSLTTPRME